MKLSALLSLVPLVAALPGSRSTTKDVNAPFGVTAARSGSPIHFLPLTASGSNFYLGGKSATYCPSEVVPGCNGRTNDTIIYGQSALDVVVPGGQAIYVAPTGALMFTTPHSGYIPAGSSQGPFHYAPGQSGNPLGTWTYTGQGAAGFMACPVPASNSSSNAAARRAAAAAPPSWQVYAALQNATVPSGNVGDCLGFDALAVGLNVTSDTLAWEYI
ncbi:hypothetical protein N7466_010048 [Penicillium verhagenii]|uniref:uncharacterized protein n=1 Tax=Penicillium verhagenii TaxID=1562060 RepID=UPI002545A754|nr:uncharacterized protein N7466_010048 [Penicillium verhagenii]KAJ5919105.1 hypothetical protein N7466_010048 [Penicillium verhagenii]